MYPYRRSTWHRAPLAEKTKSESETERARLQGMLVAKNPRTVITLVYHSATNCECIASAGWMNISAVIVLLVSLPFFLGKFIILRDVITNTSAPHLCIQCRVEKSFPCTGVHAEGVHQTLFGFAPPARHATTWDSRAREVCFFSPSF